MQATTTNFQTVKEYQQKEFLLLKQYKSGNVTKDEYFRKREVIQKGIDKAVKIRD